MNMHRTLRLYKLPDAPQIPNIQPMQKKHVPSCHKLLNEYLSGYAESLECDCNFGVKVTGVSCSPTKKFTVFMILFVPTTILACQFLPAYQVQPRRGCALAIATRARGGLFCRLRCIWKCDGPVQFLPPAVVNYQPPQVQEAQRGVQLLQHCEDCTSQRPHARLSYDGQTGLINTLIGGGCVWCGVLDIHMHTCAYVVYVMYIHT